MTFNNGQWQESIVALANDQIAGGLSTDIIATGTLTAAQATQGTPVAGGAVSITLGTGQSVVEAQLTGTYSAGTTIVFDGTDDTGTTTNWLTTFATDTSATTGAVITSQAGGASKILRISAAGFTQIRVRCSVYNGTDSVAVRLIGSTGGGGGGGGGTVTIANANANGQATMANSAPVVLASNQTGIGTLALPNINDTWISQQILAGKGFTATSQALGTATNTNVIVCCMSLFNASNSGKSLLIYSIRLISNGTSISASNTVRFTTVDPSGGTGFTNVITPLNSKLGGGNSVASASSSPNAIATSITPTGTIADVWNSSATLDTELMTSGAVLYLPSGAANGIEVTQIVATAGFLFGATVKWIEF